MATTLTPAAEAAMHREHAAYCRQQQQAREREGRHHLARTWRLDAQTAEAKAAACEEAESALMRAQFSGIAAAYSTGD